MSNYIPPFDREIKNVNCTRCKKDFVLNTTDYEPPLTVKVRWYPEENMLGSVIVVCARTAATQKTCDER